MKYFKNAISLIALQILYLSCDDKIVAENKNVEDLIIENSDFRIIEARLENKVIAVRIGFFSKDYVLDFMAASNELAKKTYANYLLLYKLILSQYSTKAGSLPGRLAFIEKAVLGRFM